MERHAANENLPGLPPDIDYTQVRGLSKEVQIRSPRNDRNTRPG